MDTEERLKKAEELLDSIIKNAEYECKMIAPGSPLDRARRFLNPEPEIDWDKVPVGTVIHVGDQSYRFSRVSHAVKTITSGYHPISDCTIPPQPSHIHKCPWPEDGKQPDWVNDDDLLVINDSDYTYKARNILWDEIDEEGDWFAVLRVAEYRK